MPVLDDTVLIRYLERQQVSLDNIPMEITGGISYKLSNIYGRKERFGEPGPDDHPVNSTITQRTWINGSLVRDSQESSDVGRFWTGHVWNQTRGALSAALKTFTMTLPEGTPAGAVTPHEKLGDYFYWTAGDADPHILEMYADENLPNHHGLRNPNELPDPVTINGQATNAGVIFRTAPTPLTDTIDAQLYIPTVEGYTRLLPDGTTHEEADFWTVGFALHENKLYRLSINGNIFFVQDHDDAWTYVATVPDGSDAHNIFRAYDDENVRCIAVTTSTGFWLLDHDNGILFETDLTYPEHPYQGLAGMTWRADIFVSVGVGVHRKVGNLITAVGLDKDDGLPPEFASGFILDMEPSYNGYFALGAGEKIGPDVGPQEEAFNLGMNLPYPIVGKGVGGVFGAFGKNRRGFLYMNNSLGWSEEWRGLRTPTRVVVSSVRNPDSEERHQHLFWGDSDGGMYFKHLPASYYNPLMSPNLPVERYWHLEGSRIDWDMPDTPKVAKQLNVKPQHLYQLIDSVPYLNEIQIVCRWRDLDGIEHTSEDADVVGGPGPYPFSDGVQALPFIRLTANALEQNSRRSIGVGWERYKNTGILLNTGLPHDTICLDWRGYNRQNILATAETEADELAGGVLEWWTIIARKWMRPVRVYEFTIDATKAIKGKDPDEVIALLDAMCLKKGAVPLVCGAEFSLVDITNLDGAQEAGMNTYYTRTVTAIETRDLTYEIVT